jgi:muconate cycloisomerase
MRKRSQRQSGRIVPEPVIDNLGDLGRDMRILSVTTRILDVPTIRGHKLSQTFVTAQSYVLVTVRLANGVEGIGEAATLGGPRWSEESVEGIKSTIDTYLAPVLIGFRADLFVKVEGRLQSAARRNNAARAALETACFDAVGKSLGLPASALLGGATTDRFPVLWTLASGVVEQEIAEAEEKLALRLHKRFKVKIGAQSAEADLTRLRRLVETLSDRADFIVDVNQAWSLTTALKFLPQLADLGISLVEQPLPAWNIAGMARLRTVAGGPPLLADECVFDEHEMLEVASAGAADAVSLKLVKHGGMLGLRKVATIAEAAGIDLYGGCLLESSVGAAAHLQIFATFNEIAWGVEHFGPQILTEDIVVEPLKFEDFQVFLPQKPGIGVELDLEKVRRFARA